MEKILLGHRDGYRRNSQIFAPEWITEALDTAQSEGRGHHTIAPRFIDRNIGGKITEVARALKARYDAGVTNRGCDNSAVAIPVLTPDRAEKRQNGRRFKEDGEPSFTLTAQDKHGVAIRAKEDIPTVWSDKYQCQLAIRKLTPKECFKLQGWTDDYFQKAEQMNSDSQLYKQAGNGVSVPVVEDIGRKMKCK